MPARGSRLTLFLACAAAPFMDAFAIASTGMCLADIPLAPALAGAAAAFYMLGALAGCSAMGSLSDRLGRKPLLAAAPAAAAAASVFLALVPAETAAHAALPASLLLAGRFLLGFFTAGDFPAAQAMLFEELPKEAGQRALIGMMIAWYAGALFAILAGTLLRGQGSWALWQLLPVPGFAAALLLRARLPESRAWSAHRAARSRAKRAAFTREDFGKAAFVCAFWLCQAIPATVIFFFGPALIGDIGSGMMPPEIELALIYAFILAGAVPALATLARAKRKTVLVSTFALMALGLALMAFQPFAWAALLGFVSFAAAYGYQSVLDFIYPAELFSPAIRGSATGAILTVSKTGAAFSAFLFPIGVTAFGSASMVAAGAFVCLAGMLFSLRFAIEPR